MLTKITKSFFSKPLALFLVTTFFMMSFKAPAGKVVLAAGNIVELETASQLNSEFAAVGQVINFKVKRDVTVDDQVVIKAGSIAHGQVVRAKGAKGIGVPGYLQVRVESVTSVDGQKIYLTGSDLNSEGKDKTTLSIVLGVLVCILFLTMKGGQAEITLGQTVHASVAQNTPIVIKEQS